LVPEPMHFQNIRRRARAATSRAVHAGFKRVLTSEIDTIQHVAAHFPHALGQRSYTLPAYVASAAQTRIPVPPGLPVPPISLRAGYCTSDESYAQSGADDTTTMRRLLSEDGAQIADLGRILELGVAAGREIRHLADLAEKQEIWGVDIWASAIRWCEENLSPPFRFATTTLNPHLPFEDRSFGLVFAGSVWTHIDDHSTAWALEVHRLLRPGGYFYFSINDRSAVKVFNGGGRDRPRYIERAGGPAAWTRWLEFLKSSADYQRFANGEAQMVAFRQWRLVHVMWDVDYMLKRLGPGWKTCSVTPEAYGHQTCVLLKRL
jgi:SAM-dependent methyltransferase